MQQGLALSYAFVWLLWVTDWGLGLHIRSLQLSVYDCGLHGGSSLRLEGLWRQGLFVLLIRR